ncbi:MAG: hypothetical protein LBH98_00075 [Chitinispirillales bacterium]|nr:hypothetical protein [Chitinispirillales bacterium]
MNILSVGVNTYSKTYSQTNTDKTAKSEASAASADTKQSIDISVLGKLKSTFSNVNFVTGKDPFSAENIKNNGKNTVYLDDAALRKIETDPRYAARVFAEIEASLNIYGKGFSYSDGDTIATLSPGATNLSFYGETENVKCVATMIKYNVGNSNDKQNSLFSFKESEKKTVNRGIIEISNNSLKKWFDVFNVAEDQRRYYDFDTAWSKLQASAS